MSENQSLACDLTAIPASLREEHVLTAPQLFRLAQEVQELPDGFAIRFFSFWVIALLAKTPAGRTLSKGSAA